MRLIDAFEELTKTMTEAEVENYFADQLKQLLESPLFKTPLPASVDFQKELDKLPALGLLFKALNLSKAASKNLTLNDELSALEDFLKKESQEWSDTKRTVSQAQALNKRLATSSTIKNSDLIKELASLRPASSVNTYMLVLPKNSVQSQSSMWGAKKKKEPEKEKAELSETQWDGIKEYLQRNPDELSNLLKKVGLQEGQTRSFA